MFLVSRTRNGFGSGIPDCPRIGGDTVVARSARMAGTVDGPRLCCDLGDAVTFRMARIQVCGVGSRGTRGVGESERCACVPSSREEEGGRITTQLD
jgi:hypothetical protein